MGFAMEAHSSSRPASGADHQIARMWEMEGHVFEGQMVSHGAAVSLGCVASLSLFDWLLMQDLGNLDIDQILSQTPDLKEREATPMRAIENPKIATKSMVELGAKFVSVDIQEARLRALQSGWSSLRDRLKTHLYRHDIMADMLHSAGAPAYASQIGITQDHLLSTLHAASFIRRRYTIFDLLHDIGQTKTAFGAVMPKLAPGKTVLAS